MVLASKSIEDQLNSSDVLSSVPDMFSPNEDKFWEALNTVHIPVAKSDPASHVVVDVDGEEQAGAEQTQQQQQQQQDRGAGAGAQEQVKELLRDHLSRNKRLFDILYFNKTPSGSLPLFEVIPTRCRSIPKEELLKEKEAANGSGSGADVAAAAAPTKAADAKERVIAKISDSQMQCIVCLKPTLLYPSSTATDQAWSEQALAAADGDGNICTSIRNRKALGNYKNTGFCHKHVYGTESASAQAYLESQCRTVRGFNLKRKTGECRIRHLLCLEFAGKGKVFLKWCTQCHLWKNFSEFYRDCNIDTFCDVCQQRQRESRTKQLLKRRSKKEKPQEAAPAPAPGQVPPGGAISDVVVVDAAVMEVSASAALTGADPMPHAPASSTSPVAVDNGNGIGNSNGHANTNGSTAMGNENGNGNISIIDAPRTPEIQEIQEQQQQKESNNNGADAGATTRIATSTATPTEGDVDKWPIAKGTHNQQDADPRYARQHRSAVIRKKRTEQEMNVGGKEGGPVDQAMEMVEAKESQALNGHRKKKNKRRPNMDPEQADRLKKFQMDLLQQIPLVDFAFWHHNESDFLRALDSVVVDKKSLREYYFRDDRLGDILFFRKDSLPGFVKESNPIPKRGMLPQLMSSDASKGIQHYPNMRISDSQTCCINSLKPLLIYPIQQQSSDGTGSANTWKLVEPKVPPCTSVRNTTEAKKRNENYKFTGFCPDCVHGAGAASQETFAQTGGASIRGFNLGRKKVDHRLRHLLCLEDKDASKVFLKWCTQCHTWKNFSSFLKREAGPTGPIQKLNTFCAVCNRRQVVSRRMQSETRVVSQTQKAAGASASFRVPVTDTIVDKNNGQQQKIVV